MNKAFCWRVFWVAEVVLKMDLLCHINRGSAKILVLCVCKRPSMNYCRVCQALAVATSEINAKVKVLSLAQHNQVSNSEMFFVSDYAIVFCPVHVRTPLHLFPCIRRLSIIIFGPGPVLPLPSIPCLSTPVSLKRKYEECGKNFVNM